MSEPIFAKWGKIYRKKGLEPRPIKPGSKACKLKKWNKPDSEFDATELEEWLEKHSHCGIGLRLGTPLPGGGVLGVIDIDDDRFVPLAIELFGKPACMRIGKKGIAIFVRVLGNPKSGKLTIKTEDGEEIAVGDLLFDGKFCVIPPTIHPDTNEPYRWIGTPLYDLDFNELPVIGE